MSPAAGPVLFDTNLIFHLLKASPLGDKVADEHSLHRGSTRSLCSVVSVGEARAFARKRRWGVSRVTRLHEVMERFAVIDIRPGTLLDHYVAFDAFCEARGRVLGKNDLWIAATAAVTGALLLTTDRDFDPLHQEGFLRRIWYDPAEGHRDP
ncbi:type II toxin-antitoxin system VapC family toxin [Melittangium boletus]|uniref:Ribonuclease VapC n=1 Tax=Melittangium boletus DSM 14713 TaxID=1294270 RepID=A0A250IF00_9BACT|nr:type II toxin-antitoxin system VapC family toxin [Melittangium boletus]ATB29813.1 PIN domain-containing protein [Melittangium boletus DSM 14713]